MNPTCPFFFTPAEHSFAAAILTPAEVIKQNAQMVDATASTKANATLQTLAKFRANPFALWRGYTALAGRNLPFTALQFPLFERLKEGIKGRRDRAGKTRGTVVESGLITAVSAGTAGAVSAVATTPVDVVKTRIMLAAAGEAVEEATGMKEGTAGVKRKGQEGLVDAMGKGVQSSKDTAKSAAQALNPLVRPEEKGRKSALAIGREIVREKGVKGLWRGGALRGVWTMIGSGLYLGVYESGRIYLAGRRGESVKEEELF